jgi:hypothetical protein
MLRVKRLVFLSLLAIGFSAIVMAQDYEDDYDTDDFGTSQEEGPTPPPPSGFPGAEEPRNFNRPPSEPRENNWAAPNSNRGSFPKTSNKGEVEFRLTGKRKVFAKKSSSDDSGRVMIDPSPRSKKPAKNGEKDSQGTRGSGGENIQHVDKPKIPDTEIDDSDFD